MTHYTAEGEVVIYVCEIFHATLLQEDKVLERGTRFTRTVDAVHNVFLVLIHHKENTEYFIL